MKILIINYHALPIPASKGGAVENLVDSLIRKNEETGKFDIHIVSVHDENAINISKELDLTTFHYINLQSPVIAFKRLIYGIANRLSDFRFGNVYINQVTKSLELNQYDLVIVENAPHFGRILRSKYNGRLILHLHNDFISEMNLNSVEILKAYSEVWTISEFLKGRVERIIDHFNLGIPVHVFYNAINLKLFQFDTSARDYERYKLGISNDDFVFMYFGRLVEEKGVLELIRAFRKVITDQKTRLIIVGAASYGKNEITDYVNKLYIEANSDPRVIFLGYQEYRQIPDLYSVGDVGVIPSKINEGFNLTSIEFLSTGIPVIASNRGALPEIIETNCGYIYDGFDNSQLERLLSHCIKNPNDISSMRSHCARASKRYSLENYFKRFIELCECRNEQI